MGDARTSYGHPVRMGHQQSALGISLCSQSFLEAGAVAFVFVSITLQLRSEVFTMSLLRVSAMNEFLSSACSLCF